MKETGVSFKKASSGHLSKQNHRLLEEHVDWHGQGQHLFTNQETEALRGEVDLPSSHSYSSRRAEIRK